jgi:hypothetical protein
MVYYFSKGTRNTFEGNLAADVAFLVPLKEVARGIDPAVSTLRRLFRPELGAALSRAAHLALLHGRERGTAGGGGASGQSPGEGIAVLAGSLFALQRATVNIECPSLVAALGAQSPRSAKTPAGVCFSGVAIAPTVIVTSTLVAKMWQHMDDAGANLRLGVRSLVSEAGPAPSGASEFAITHIVEVEDRDLALVFTDRPCTGGHVVSPTVRRPASPSLDPILVIATRWNGAALTCERHRCSFAGTANRGDEDSWVITGLSTPGLLGAPVFDAHARLFGVIGRGACDADDELRITPIFHVLQSL